MQIVRVAPGESSGEWAAALASFDPDRSEVLKRDEDTGVYAAHLLGRAVVVKAWSLTAIAGLKSRLGAGRAARHWRGAAWLTSRGIRTARCYAMARDCADGHRREWLVMERLDGPTALDLLAPGSLGACEQHALARAIGGVLGRIERGGRYNRDSKPSNLIVVGDPGALPTVAVIDCVAIRPLPPWRQVALARMHASAVIEAIGCGRRPRRSLLMRGLLATLERDRGRRPDAGGRAKRSRRWHEARRLIESHGDPTPRVDPLRGR